MAWLYNGTVIKAGKSWVGSATDEEGTTIDVVHPKNWMIWSDEDKTSNGLVWQDDEDTSYDSTFYWAKDVPKSLEDTNNVDDDGNPMLDDDGNQTSRGAAPNPKNLGDAPRPKTVASNNTNW